MYKPEINIYCDESCHLENDDSPVMVLGAVWCPKEKRREIFYRIKEIKNKHKLGNDFEIKWNKVSSAKVEFYRDIIDYFFDDDDLGFRGVVISNKAELDHERYNQTYDLFYYKMYFTLLKAVINNNFAYNIYLDIKDTLGYEKVGELQDVLRNNQYDFDFNIVRKIQEVRSDEVALLQVADLLIGALSYKFRSLSSNSGKLSLISRIRERSGFNLSKNTLPTEKKFNLLLWSSDWKRSAGSFE